MKRSLRILLLSLVMVFVAGKAVAQDYIPVEGYIYNIGKNVQDEPAPGHKHPFFDGVIIYIYETEAEGEIARRNLLQWIDKHKKGLDVGAFDPGEATYKDLSQGTEWPYTLAAVSPEGSLLFFNVLNQDDCKLVKVRGRERIDVSFDIRSEGAAFSLEGTTIVAKTRVGIKVIPPVQKGDTINLMPGYSFPKDRMGKSDARFALQSFMISPVDSTDTIGFRKAVVMDGPEYHETQLRRMGYDGSRDALFMVADASPRLSDTTTTVYWKDKIVRNSKTKGGLLKANVWFEDYNHVYHSETYEVEDLSRVVDPMRFLEFTLETTDLDPHDPIYIRTPEKKLVPGEMQLPINFELGKAVVSPSDTSSMMYLDSLRRTVYDLTNTPGKRLLKYSIYGYASPEGGYAKNLSLATERLNYINRQVQAEISATAAAGMRRSETQPHVCTWAEFADTLAKDPAMASYAQEIRDIVADYPGDNAAAFDKQFARIHRLPYYNTIIKDNLSRMRLVNFMYTTQVSRELTAEEIMDLYYNDPKYQERPRSEEFLPAEFWVLMQHVKDTTELEKICRRAMRQDLRDKRIKKSYQHWALPANKLATLYIKRHHADTTLLAPYIDETERLNRPIRDYDESTGNFKPYMINPTAVVANQVSMMILAECYTRAVELAELFRDTTDPKLQGLYAIARCKAGYFEEDAETFYNMVHDTSPRNAVVMDMAIPMYSAAVPDEMEDLNPDDPVTYYLKAQYECYHFFINENKTNFKAMDKDVQDEAIRNLVRAFRMNPALMDEAYSDWYIFKDLYLFAKKEYEEPGSVLPPEEEETEGPSLDDILDAMTEEQKNDLIIRGNNDYKGLSDQDRKLYDRYNDILLGF